MIIRDFKESDANELLEIFFNTIRTVNIKDYTQEQVELWAPDINTIDKEWWCNLFNNKTVIVAEENEELIGFCEFERNGHIDRFYVHKDFIGKGIGSKLHIELEKRAKEDRISKLFVEASITARPFFEKQGFLLEKEQSVLRDNVALINFLMNKKIM